MADPTDEEHEPQHVAAIVERLEEAFGAAPAIGLVLGSGLGGLVDDLDAAESRSYAALGLPASTVAGHAGHLVVGTLAGVRVAVFAGRVHLYEGRRPAEVVRYVRALARWGGRALILTNAVGGIGAGFEPGTIAIIGDHLNLQGRSPLVGPAFGERFPDLSRAYHPGLRQILQARASAAQLDARPAVLAAMLGPAYETPAEVRMLELLGADVVGMSTVPEVLAAAEVGLPCAVLSLVSNRAAGRGSGVLSHRDVVDVSTRAGHQVRRLLRDAVPAIASALAQDQW